jgi:hypothetical protein
MKQIFLLLLFLLLPQQLLADTIADFVPISHWKFDEASGVRYDSVNTSQNDLTDGNTVDSTTGILNNAALFDYSNSEYLEITDGNHVGLDFTSDFSVSLWAKMPEGHEEAQRVLLTKHNNTGNQRSYRIDYDSTDSSERYFFYISNNGSTWSYDDLYVTSNPLTTDVFKHLVFSFDASAGTAELWINGSLEGTFTGLHTSIYNSSAPFGFGTSILKKGDMIIDEASVLDYALAESDIETLYNNGTPLSYDEEPSQTSNIKIIPYNNLMPELQTVVCEASTCTLAYATTTTFYPTLTNLFLLLLLFVISVVGMGYLTYKFL